MKKKKFQLEVPGGADKVLLHTCCAPCSSAIIECLMQHGITPVIYYCNPNIYPLEEYNIRKDECTRYAQSLGLEIVLSTNRLMSSSELLLLKRLRNLH